MAKGPFIVIDGTPAPDTPKERMFKRLRAQPKPGHIARCPRCTGIAVLEIKLGVEIYAGKARGGQKQLICAGPCLSEGRHVVIHF